MQSLYGAFFVVCVYINLGLKVKVVGEKERESGQFEYNRMLRLALTPKHTLHLPPPPLLFSPALLPHAVHFAKSPLKRPTSLHCNGTFATSKDDSHVTVPQSEPEVMHKQEEVDGKFMAAMALIIGTAVGPGILGLPAATLRAGLLPSTIIIVVSWVYVITSILLIAEISFNTMQEQSVKEVSYTGLAHHTFGPKVGCIIATVYAMLNYALLMACISGLGSILQKWLSFFRPPFPLLVCPLVVAAVVTCSSFKVIDSMNQALCVLMLVSISVLLVLGICFGQGSLLSSWHHGIWSTKALLPAIPVSVLTLGFHVITPVVCRVIGRPQEARTAILCGGLVPLIMVLSWNAVVLGLAPRSAVVVEPIQLLLSVSSFAGPAVQAFAFSALGTTLIGYALSFPKQLLDTLALFTSTTYSSPKLGRVDCLSMEFSEERNCCSSNSRTMQKVDNQGTLMLMFALGPPTVMSLLHPGAFASALDFAGIYANCFLFGFLPPLMAWQYRYGTAQRHHMASDRLLLVPGGRILLVFLTMISLYLGLVLPRS